MERNTFMFYGLLVYVVFFYSQIAARFPFLVPLRLEFILGLVLVGTALILFASGSLQFNENKMNLTALLFIAVAFLTVPFALVRSRALDAFIHLVKFFAIYLMIVAGIRSERQLRLFMYVYLAMIALLFVQPFLLSLVGEGFRYNNHMMRLFGVTGYFAHPNQLGGITAANLPFFFYLMLAERGKMIKLLCLALLGISVRVIMLTQSRTAFVGLMVFGAAAWLQSKRKAFALILAVVFLGLLWVMAPQETKDRFMTFAQVDRILGMSSRYELSIDENVALGSMASRYELLKRGFVAFTENPILGLGLNCFISFNGQRYGYYFPPHNTYIQALSEMGIIGFGAFVFVIVLTFQNLLYARRMLKKRKMETTFLGHMATATLVYLICELVVASFGQDLYENYWWVTGGLSVVIVRLVKSIPSEKVSSNKSIT
jgi:O-antigen ligase